MMKRIYENPELELFRISNEDILTASGFDDIVGDIWGGGVSPEIFH